VQFTPFLNFGIVEETTHSG